MFLPEGARHLASVPPPAPLPTMMTSKRLSMVTPLETNAAMHDASVCEDGGRSHITRAVAGKESDDVRNLLRARHAPERYSRIELREFSRIGHRAQIDRRRYCPGADANNKNLMTGEFETGGAREHTYAAFGEAIGRIAGHRPVL